MGKWKSAKPYYSVVDRGNYMGNTFANLSSIIGHLSCPILMVNRLSSPTGLLNHYMARFDFYEHARLIVFISASPPFKIKYTWS
jgi:hypothetical protein